MKNNSKYSLVTLLLFMLATLTVNATDFTVNSLADTNTGAGTSGTLRWCINQANAAGAGPHTITFDNTLSGGIVTLSSSLPVVSVSNVTIDGIGDGSGNITIDANGGDITRYVFRANGTGDFATFKNFIIQNTGYEPFRFDGSPTDITIENIVALHTGGNFFNYGVNFQGNALRLSIVNFKMTQKQNISEAAIYISGTANNVLIDNFDLSESGGGRIEAIRFRGAAANITIQNCDIDLDLLASGDDGDFGIRFLRAASNITLNDNTFTNIDSYALFFGGTTSNINISNYEFVNGGGGTTVFGMRFVGVASNINMTNITLDMYHSDTTDDGDYGIFFDRTASNVTLDNVIMHDAERYGLYFGGVVTDFEITNSTFDNFNGGTSNLMIYFRNIVNGLIMANVDIDLNLTDNGTSLDDGDYGIYFNSRLNDDETKNASLNNVVINQADSHGIYLRSEANNLTIDGCSFTGNSESSAGNNYGIEFDNDSQKRNITITNSTFANLGSAAILIDMDGTNATSNNKITNNTISGTVSSTHPGYGIWLWQRNAVTDLEISGNEIFDNASNGIQIETVDGVHISENSIYNNLQGINNVSNSGNNGLKQAHGDTPVIISSVNVGGGNYDVTFNLPAFCTDCDIEFFTNNTTDAENNGRTYVQTTLGLSAVNNPHTIPVSSGGNSTGFWTTTLKDNNQNGSVSEFGKSIAIDPQGPANVDAGIALWLRADISGQPIGNFTVNNGWRDFSGNGNHYEQAVSSDPELVDGVANFNHSVVFDGNDWLNTLNTDLKAFPSGNDDRTVFIVSNTTSTGSDTSFSYGRNATSQNQSWRHENGNIRYIGWGNDFVGTGTFAVNEPFIGRYDHSGTIASINSNGREVITSPRTYNTNFSTGSSHIGVRITAGAEGFIGNISEVVVYNRNLTIPEKNGVESYLAIKYGIPLDQTIPTNYVSSDGTIIWDATTNATYNNDVTGIGRDDETSLNQKQSKSINTDDIVTIGLGEIALTNAANANTFSADTNFLIWGNDDASLVLQTTDLPAAATAVQRIGREWKVDETGTVNNLLVAFSNTPPTANNLELYIDTDGDGDFSNATIITGGTLVNGTATFTGVDLNDGDVFTLGYTLSYPGGVVPGGDPLSLKLWLRADDLIGNVDGVSIPTWVDNSASGNNATQATVSLQPKYTEVGNNFNPIMTFDGSDRFNLPLTMMGTGNYPYSFFSEVRANNNNNIYNVDVGGSINDPLNVGISRPGTHWHRTTSGYSGPDALATSTYGAHLIGSSRTSNTVTHYHNGLGGVPRTKNAHGGAVQGRWIGYRSFAGGMSFNGQISEMIIYDVDLTNIEKQRINSYMAIKYGFPLDQSIPYNYLASDASVIWDATANAAYSNDIAGIGRDDLGALNQKQSKSVNDDAIVTIGLGDILGTNGANGNTFNNDKDFLLWGNDDASTALQTSELPATANVLYRLGREWKVQETGTVSNLTISFSNLSLSHLATNYELYVDTDGDGNFTNATVITGGIESGGVVTFTGVDLNNGDVFTLGLTQPFPGGVAANLQLWLGADSGITEVGGNDITQWLDINGANTPVFYNSDPDVLDSGSDLVNFNPVVHFDNDDFIRWDGNSFMNGSTAGELFMMGKEANPVTADHGHLFDFGGGGASFYTYRNQYIYDDFGSSDRKVWRPNIPVLSLSEGTANGATLASGVPAVNTTDYNIYNLLSETNNWQSAFNGFTYVTDITNAVNFTGIHHLGARSGATSNGGRISEIVLYDRVLLTNERERVNTYLAIKYGNTLGHDYYASDWNGTTGTTLWTLGGGYDNDIAGIGQDDASLLNQKQSKSINDDAIVTIGLGTIAATNIANTNTFTNDKDFLVWGNDNASIDLQTTELPAGTVALQRLGREWKVQEAGVVDNLTVAFDNIPISPLATDFELYIDTDGDGNFANATIVTGGVESGGTITFAAIDLNDGDVFTLGFTEPAPGGVTSGLDFWFDPAVNVVTSGTSVTQWGDRSVSGNNPVLAQGTASLSPTFSPGSSSSNFNPYVDFTSNTRLHQTVTGSNYAQSHSTFAAYRNNQAAPGSIYAHFLRFSSASNSDGGSHRWGFGYNIYPGAKSVGIHYISAPFSNGSLGPYITYQYNQYNTSKEWATGTTGIVSAIIDQAGSQTIMGFDGNESVNNVTVNNSGLTPYNYLTVGGGSTYGQRGWGQEIIEYSRALSLIERQKVNTYLAIKYGITLDQTAATDYLTSDASIIWNATTNAAYSNDIASIGRDDLSALDQKQSKSVNPDAIVTIGLGSIEATNMDNSNTFTNDTNFLVWGNDNASTAVVNTGIPSTFSEKTTRNWLVNETGAVGNTLVRIPNSAVAGFSSTTELALFVADDEDFTTNLVTIPLTQNGANWETTIDFDGIKYFTFGIVAPSDFMRHGKFFQGGVERPMKF